MTAHHEQQSWSEVEEALRRSQALATAGQFAAAIMHEINNPLEVISNLAFLVRDNAGDPAKVREYAEILDQQLRTVIRIAHQTLSFYKPLDTLEAIDLIALAEAALRVHERKISAKRIRLVKDFPEAAPVRAHAGEMLQVISNLVSNALDALPDNGTLCVRVRRRQSEVHVMVSDDGHGIPVAVLPKVFEPFFTTKKELGTGIGLAISKAIVDRHRGRIKTRSSVRQGKSGTTFRISLPLDSGERAA